MEDQVLTAAAPSAIKNNQDFRVRHGSLAQPLLTLVGLVAL